jgi:hypothetical protein
MIRVTVELSGVGSREELKGHQFLPLIVGSSSMHFENQATGKDDNTNLMVKRRKAK